MHTIQPIHCIRKGLKIQSGSHTPKYQMVAIITRKYSLLTVLQLFLFVQNLMHRWRKKGFCTSLTCLALHSGRLTRPLYSNLNQTNYVALRSLTLSLFFRVLVCSFTIPIDWCTFTGRQSAFTFSLLYCKRLSN